MEMARRPNPRGELPIVAESAYVDPGAVLIGNVSVEEDVFIGPGAVIRADEPGSSIEIGRGSNVQDRVVIHALEGSRVCIGEGVSLAHGCVVHGPCTIGAGCFVGFGSVVFRAELGEEVVVRHLAVVEGVEIEAGRLVGSGCVIDSPTKARRLKPPEHGDADFAKRVAAMNLLLTEGYRERSGG